jgi:hypothetical protein
MNTKCKCEQLEFQGFERRKITVKNDGKMNSSDGGFLLLQQIDRKFHIIKRLADCFNDNRNIFRTVHSLESLLTQRIFGICQGYEDLNDHEELRHDSLLQYICGTGGKYPVAGKSTLNRLELGMEPDEKLGEWMSSNQLRLWFSAIAYIFFVHLQKIIQNVTGDEIRKMPSTIRLKILKVSAVVKITFRNVWVSLPESFPYWDIWIKLSKAF